MQASVLPSRCLHASAMIPLCVQVVQVHATLRVCDDPEHVPVQPAG